MSPRSNHTLTLLLIALVSISTACATNLPKPTITPQPVTVRLGTFDKVTLLPITIAPEYAGSGANQKAARKINEVLEQNAKLLFKNLRVAQTVPSSGLVITPEIVAIKFIGGAARFWVGAMAGSSRADIERAAKTAHALGFIEQLPEGFDTVLGEDGVRLSGGQRQRLAIARAILKDAPILILDEATSSLDSQTEKYIQESLNLLIEDQKKTVIAIAHRLSTLKHMDRIIVLDDKGAIAEEGSHDQLISDDSSLYKKLWDLQEI